MPIQLNLAEVDIGQPTYLSAYVDAVEAQNWLTSQPQEEDGIEKALIYIRVLGHLLTHGPNDSAKSSVATAIHSCNDDVALITQGEHYYFYYIRCFRKYKGSKHTSSGHSSRSSFDATVEEIQQLLVDNNLDHRSAKRAALLRDNYRCMITGRVDRNSYRDNRAVRDHALQHKLKIDPTQCAHILPESTNSGIEKNEDKRLYSANVWAILQSFGHPTLRKQLAGKQIHSLKNILTMTMAHHDSFDELNLWFEAIPGNPNTYNLKVAPIYEHDQFDLPTSVRFQSSDPSKYELPDPGLLELHAACCRVAWMSGAAEYMDWLDGQDDCDPSGPVPACNLSALLSELRPERDDSGLLNSEPARPEYHSTATVLC